MTGDGESNTGKLKALPGFQPFVICFGSSPKDLEKRIQVFVYWIESVIGFIITDINRFTASTFKPSALKLLIFHLAP